MPDPIAQVWRGVGTEKPLTWHSQDPFEPDPVTVLRTLLIVLVEGFVRRQTLLEPTGFVCD